MDKNNHGWFIQKGDGHIVPDTPTHPLTNTENHEPVRKWC